MQRGVGGSDGGGEGGSDVVGLYLGVNWDF